MSEELNGTQKPTNVVSFSGGKDSTALILWAKENLDSFITIFCDTSWEDPITYEYVQHINKTLLNGKLVTLKSDKYKGLHDLVVKKKRAPSVMARFCTEELKVKPTEKYIKSLDSEVQFYVGIRADESEARAKLPTTAWHDIYECYIHRPLIRWTSEDVFKLHEKYGIEPNPLYKMGMLRVGCMPCCMVKLKELRSIVRHRPEAINKVRSLENDINRTFLPHDRIPQWAMNSRDPQGVKIGFIDDFVKYVQANPDQEEMFELPSCMSYYNLCE